MKRRGRARLLVGGLLWSLDNAPYHRNLALPASKRLPLPANSPDMHKVVEHAIGLLKQSFKKKFSWDQNVNNGEVSWKTLSELAPLVIKAESVCKDVMSLRKTYEKVIELGGKRVPAPWN